MALYPRNGQAIGRATTVYNTKITAPTSASLEINLPSNNGTLALLTDIPDVPDVGDLSTTSSISLTPDVDETLTNHIELHRISKTGDYNDLLNQPNILQVIPNVGVLSTTATTTLTPDTDESLTGRVELHKVSKTGAYGDLVGTPSIGSGEITVSMGGSTVGSFNVNQSSASTVNVPVAKIPRKEIYNVIYSQEFTKRKSDSGSFGSGTYYFAQMIPVDPDNQSFLRVRITSTMSEVISTVSCIKGNTPSITLQKCSLDHSVENISVLNVNDEIIESKGFQIGFISGSSLTSNVLVEILEEYNCDIIWISEAEGETDLSIAYERSSLSYASDYSSGTETSAPFVGVAGISELGSHAEGYSTTTLNSYAHSEGSLTTAFGMYSHVEGYTSLAMSTASHSEGIQTKAIGESSHSEGNQTTANGVSSHSEGQNTYAVKDYSHAEGYQTSALGSYSSHSEGYQTYSSGMYGAHSEGSNTYALGIYSHTEGYMTTSTGCSNHAEGHGTYATGNDTHAEGAGSKALGGYSHAEGHNTSACGDSSHSEGNNTYAQGYYSHAEGGNTTARNDGAHSEGYYTSSYGIGAHSEGYRTYAINNQAHSEGYGTTAIGYRSHSEGEYTYATRENSHAGGVYSTASGTNSFTHGLGLSSTGESHTSFGTYNQVGDYATDDPFIFTVGNGTANNARSNALAVAKSGCVVIGGPELVLTGPDGSTVTIKYDHVNKTVTYVYSQ